jgi:hypothetical protein
MIDLVNDILDVPAAQATILQDRETNSLQRTFVFRNLTPNTLTLIIQESLDGAAWTTVGVSFTVGPAGAGADIVVKNTTSGNLLRVRGQAGGADRDLEVTLLRLYADTNHIWASPLV